MLFAAYEMCGIAFAAILGGLALWLIVFLPFNERMKRETEKDKEDKGKE